MGKKQRRLLERFNILSPPVQEPTPREGPLGDDALPFYINDPKRPFTFKPQSAKPNFIPELAGTFKEMDGDRFESLEKNKKIKENNPEWLYHTKEVRYTTNRDGYRTYEWDKVDWPNAIVIFGCSCTYGIGVDDDHTLSAYLEKYSGRQVVNLGVGGGSNSLMLQNNLNLLENFGTPYAVVNNWSTSDRFEFFGKHNPYHAGPWDGLQVNGPRLDKGPSDMIDIEQLWKNTFADPSHEAGLSFYEGQMGKWLWEGRCKYASISFFPGSPLHLDKYFVIDNKARDLIHPGPDNYKEIAKYLWKRFQ